MNPALHPYRVRCAGLEYVALATGACMAIEQALALHGLRKVSAQPMRLKGGAA